MNHDKPGSSDSIVEACITEEYSSEQAVNCVSFEVIGGCGYNTAVRGEDTGKQISVEEGQKEHTHTDHKGCQGPIMGVCTSDYLRHNPDYCCSRSCETNFGQAGIGLNTHIVCQRKTHK